MTASDKLYTLLDAHGQPYSSTTPGRLGGHRRHKLYGRLDCPAALRALATGGYVRNRVFFADEQTAIAAGYGPCAVCLREAYKIWNANRARAPSTCEQQTQCLRWRAISASTTPAATEAFSDSV